MSLACHAVGRRGAFAFDIGFDSPARCVAVVGPSGCGKTTFLHALAGLITGCAAQIRIDDTPVLDDRHVRQPVHRRAVGYVFQDIRLFPHLTVEQNIAFAGPYGRHAMTVSRALELMDLRGFERRRPGGLSGGEARRVALARALVAQPRLLLLDEPFTGLDVQRRERLAPYLLRLRDEAGLPMILVSHDPRDLALIAQDVVVVQEGRVAISRTSKAENGLPMTDLPGHGG